MFKLYEFDPYQWSMYCDMFITVNYFLSAVWRPYSFCVIIFQENHAPVQDVIETVDLEQVEVMQKKFDDFQTDLKANEVRLAEMNEIAMQLMSLGQTEAALKIQTQLQVQKFKCILSFSYFEVLWFFNIFL